MNEEQASGGASVTLHEAPGRIDQDEQKAETVEGLKAWLRDLAGCPAISRVVIARCECPIHGNEPGTWFYVEADATEGVARLRCLACGDARSLLDSAERWTYPSVWSCTDCGQSIAEVGYGVHVDGGDATWMAVAARCVNCGALAGLTDLVVPDIAADVFASSL
jgi:ribosomal protein L37AE/L43A